MNASKALISSIAALSVVGAIGLANAQTQGQNSALTPDASSSSSVNQAQTTPQTSTDATMNNSTTNNSTMDNSTVDNSASMDSTLPAQADRN